MLFNGHGDVREFVKDRVFLVQAATTEPGLPAAHTLLHRHVLEQLGYAAPPVGESWLHLSLWLQHVFGSLGRYRRLSGVRFIEVDEDGQPRGRRTSAASDASSLPPLLDPTRLSDESSPDKVAEKVEVEPTGGQSTEALVTDVTSEGTPRFSISGDSSVKRSELPGGPFRLRFERSAVRRALDVNRLRKLQLVLRPKPLSSLEIAAQGYAHFSVLYNEGEIAEAWPMLAEIEWSLLSVQQTEDDWEMRDSVETMLPPIYDLQGRLLDWLARWE
jgi:hypothetical protein